MAGRSRREMTMRVLISAMKARKAKVMRKLATLVAASLALTLYGL